MNRIKICARNWNMGTESYGDGNIIHRRNSAGLRYGLKGKIAPGVWSVAHIQGRVNPSSIAQVKFSGSVYNGDTLEIREIRRSKRGVDYVFMRGDDKVSEVNGVGFGAYTEAPRIFTDKDLVHSYNSVIDPVKLEMFMKSIGLRYEGGFPNMYAFCLSASSLLSLGKKREFIGIHASQSYEVHEDFENGPINVLVGKERVKGKGENALYYFSQQWVQNDKVKASGRAGVVLLDPSKVAAPNFCKDLVVDARYFFKNLI